MSTTSKTLRVLRRTEVPPTIPEWRMNISAQETLGGGALSEVENGFSARLPRNMKGVASEVSILGRAKGVC